MKFTLSEEDMQRLCLPEALAWDWDTMSVTDARTLRKVTGIAAMDLGKLWDERDENAMVAVVWLAAKRGGVELDYATLDFNLWGLRAVEDEADEQGKEPSPDSETSTPTPTRTRRSSATSAT